MSSAHPAVMATSQQISQRPSVRPRSKSRFSFRSDKSGSSHGRKQSLVETHAEKEKRNMSQTTKANPNAAINEAQPVAAALEKATIGNLTSQQCFDIYGNPINDPDRSNPTRWRLERPLDTIRSFEAAIDKAHNQRQSGYFQPPPPGLQSRRTSTYWENNQGHPGYAHSRPPNSQAPSFAGYGASRDNLNDYNQHRANNNAGYSDPALNRYAPPSRSKDTLQTGGSSGSEHWGNSTAPTSEESSIDRANGVSRPMSRKQPPGQTEGYSNYTDGEVGYDGRPPRPPPHAASSNGHMGYGAGPSGYGGSPGGYNGSPGGYGGNSSGYGQYQHQTTPSPPRMDQGPAPPPKQVIPLGAPAHAGAVQPIDDKRQSWFKKRFSRGNK